MTDPYRALAQELVEAWDATSDFDFNDFGHAAADIADRARALLAEPEAEGPSELELEAIELALWDKYRSKGWGGEEFMYDNNFSHALEEYRAAIARWGRPAAAPVPVSERPWERQGWCDKYGRCWFGWADEPDASWSFCKPSERDTATVSLPAHALPTPEAAELEGLP